MTTSHKHIRANSQNKPDADTRQRDPVCGMPAARDSLHQLRYQGIKYYFCSEHCAAQFSAGPAKFIHTRSIAIRSATPVPDKEIKDPVCGMVVDAASPHTAQYQGASYVFCCAGCVKKFNEKPDFYLKPSEVSAVPLTAGQIAEQKKQLYSCPMHPEAEQMGPGSCPLCGMALDPMEVTAHIDTTELDDFTRRFKWSLGFTIPLLLLSMGGMFPGIDVIHIIGVRLRLAPHTLHIILDYLQLLLASPVVLWIARPFFERAITSFRTRHLNMFSLIGLGVASAYSFSVILLFFSSLLPSALSIILPKAFRTGSMLPLYFESAAVIITLVLLGQILELRARARTQDALQALLALTPTQALRVRPDGSHEEVSLKQLVPGDLLRVLPGTQIPVDGILTEGISWVDEAMLTGEAMPQEKSKGKRVSAGTINQTGSFIMRTEKTGGDTLLAAIIDLVNQAGRSRASIQQLADRVAGWFVPAVIGCAVLSAVVWILSGASLPFALLCAISVLLIACPCALGLATPISITVAIGRAAGFGVLIKEAGCMEWLAKADTLVIDKTGTITEGKPTVQDIVSFSSYSKHDILRYAAALEHHSEHPLARAVVSAANETVTLTMPLPLINDFSSQTGLGVEGHSESQDLLLGSPQFLAQHQCDISLLNAELAARPNQSVMGLSIDGKLVGALFMADQIKPDSASILQELRQAGLRIILLTGDNDSSAAAVAQHCGIRSVRANMLPADKFEQVQRLQQQGKIVVMAGDGINDAPALTKAHVGIAMGNGSDIAMQSAGIILLKGDLRGILRARRLSMATIKNIRQNLFFAFIYNFAGVPVAAGLLYHWTGWLLSPVLAAAAMSLSSVTVIMNALRLRLFR